MMDRDLADLLKAWVGGDTTEECRHRVLTRLREDSEFRQKVVREIHLLGMLKVLRSAETRWLRLEDELGWCSQERSPSSRLADAVVARVETLPIPTPESCTHSSRWSMSPSWVLATVVMVAILGGLIWLSPRPTPDIPPAVSRDAIALLVRLEGPGWEGKESPTEGSIVRPGLLSLRGGSATLAFFNGVTVHIEGPTDIDLQSANRLYCHRGNLRIDTPIDCPGFATDLPGASISEPAAEFALNVEDNTSDVMVFAGQAEVSLLDSFGQPLHSERLTDGQSVRLNPGARLLVPRVADPKLFAGPIPGLAPRLELDPDYQTVVMESRPANYWRFETVAEGRTPNEVVEGPALQLIGQATPVGPVGGNHSLHFPSPTEWEQHGALAEDSWIPSGQDYAVECWAMSRVVRHSALVGLVAETDTAQLRQYGVLVEMTGLPALFQMPDRSIRALHRFPVEKVRGINLFTPTCYLPYQWQHILAQRAGNRFELYLDGELAAVTPITVVTPLPPFRVLIGALYARQDGSSVSDRPFVGSIDEVAVYDRSLRRGEVVRHARLGKSISPR